ncbi:PAS domain-containing protein [Mesonia maritima]|uniref:PAS domain-containing protein n=1 Tax=Mesonia maritima TaxID=1793873 RepID=UPI003634B3FB
MLKKFLRCVHPDDFYKLASISRNIQTLEHFHIQYRIYKANRSIIWVEEIGSITANAEGKKIIDGVIFDVTEKNSA